MSAADYLGKIALERAGVASNTHAVYRWECIPHGPGPVQVYRLSIAPYEDRWMPRKKQTRRHFDVKQKAEVYISPEALATAQREFEAGTGVCHECQGAGQQMISCSVIDGTTFGPCSRCKGVGKAPLKGKAE